MKSLSLLLTIATLLTALVPERANAHCQVPCGIYGDEARFTEMEEHLATVTKAMAQITELSADPKANQNQLVRWVVNKESHAQKIQDIVAEYFLAQRIKFPKDDAGKAAYLKHLEMLHQITVYAMKCKQTTDAANSAALGKSLAAFKVAYLKKVSMDLRREKNAKKRPA